MNQVRFSQIFAPELHERLLWFGRLRWLAVSGLVLVALVGPRLGFDAVWPSMFLLACVVAGYNFFFQFLLGRHQRFDRTTAPLGPVAICVMVLDLSVLMVTTHYTGGLQSPLLPFFAFHMAIGPVMIARRKMYLLAGGVSLGALGLLLLETQGLLPFHPVTPVELDPPTAGLNLLILVVAMFGIVHLTGSVARLLRRRNIELYETTETLSERTEELQRLLEQMEDLERRKSHYMRISAHQLRSPLGTIKTVLGVLTGGYVDPSSERGRRLLDGAVEVSDNLLAVVNDLLDLAGLREGRRRAPWSRGVNLNQLLADLFDSLASEAEQRQVAMVPDFEGVAVLDWGVPPDLVHAFENLMYNGLKYSPPGGQLTVRLRVDGDSAVVDVIDRGIGIPQDYVDQIFLEFVRAPNAKHFAAEGTGLGLAIVKEVVESHGGSISATSEEGEGSTFRVRMKLEHAPPKAERALPAGNESGYGAETNPEDSDAK